MLNLNLQWEIGFRTQILDPGLVNETPDETPFWSAGDSFVRWSQQRGLFPLVSRRGRSSSGGPLH